MLHRRGGCISLAGDELKHFGTLQVEANFLPRRDCDMGCLCKDTIVHFTCLLQNKLLIQMDGAKELLHLLSFATPMHSGVKAKECVFFLVMSACRRISYPR